MSEADSDVALDNPSFVEWAPYIVTVEATEGGLVTNYEALSFNKCTTEDFKHFHPTEENQKPQLNVYKRQNFFYCLDEKDKYGNPVDFTIYGGT